MTNQQIIEKAAITTANLASGGQLNPVQQDKFIDFVFDESILAGIARMVKFNGLEYLIEKIGVGRRVAVPKAEAADPAIRRGVSTSKITLHPVEIMVPFEIGDLFKETGIEGDGGEEHVVKMMAKQLANNLDELYWLGHATGPAILEADYADGGSATLYRLDSYLKLFSGFLKAAEAGHVVDAAGAAISQAEFGKALRAMPNKFKKSKTDLRWFVSADHEQAYLEALSHRATALGDQAVNTAFAAKPYGIDMVPVSLLPENPTYCEDSVANADGVTATALSFAPITGLVLLPQNLAAAPTAKYVLGVDYSQDLSAGTWTRLAGGAIGAGATIKATYNTGGRAILTNPKNLVIAVARDVRIEKDRNIYKGVNEFAITARVYATFEETDAVVLVKNIAVPS